MGAELLLGEVVLVEPAGKDQNRSLILAGYDISVGAQEAQIFAVGDKAHLLPDASKALLFYAKSGLRLGREQ